METPTELNDFENIRWFMLHGRVSVFVDSGTWYLCVFNKCDHLRPDNMCGIYETRPQICRDYSADSCEYDNDGLYEQLFETPDQIWEYAMAILPMEKPEAFSPGAAEADRSPAAVGVEPWELPGTSVARDACHVFTVRTLQ